MSNILALIGWSIAAVSVLALLISAVLLLISDPVAFFSGAGLFGFIGLALYKFDR